MADGQIKSPQGGLDMNGLNATVRARHASEG